jgi:hypothetical protein
VNGSMGITNLLVTTEVLLNMRGVSGKERYKGLNRVQFVFNLQKRHCERIAFARCTFTFCVEKSYDGTHRAFGGTWQRRRHFKHVSLKAGHTVMYLHFPDTPRSQKREIFIRLCELFGNMPVQQSLGKWRFDHYKL